jgi:hypothetical protein
MYENPAALKSSASTTPKKRQRNETFVRGGFSSGLVIGAEQAQTVIVRSERATPALGTSMRLFLQVRGPKEDQGPEEGMEEPISGALIFRRR